MNSNDSFDENLNDFHQTYLKYNKLIRRIVFRIVGAHDVDDIVQECFVKAWHSRDSFKGESSIKTWICRIAVNVSIDQKRKNAVRKNTESVNDIDKYGYEQKTEFLKEIIQTAIDCLKEDFKAAFILVVLEGFSTKEAADTLKIDEGTLRSRVSRARSQIREFLTKNGVKYEE